MESDFCNNATQQKESGAADRYLQECFADGEHEFSVDGNQNTAAVYTIQSRMRTV